MADNSSSAALDLVRVEAFTNGRYHADREAFLDAWRRRFSFAVILLGASAFSDTMPTHFKVYAGLFTAAIGALDLVLDLATRARSHAFLRRQYFEVAAAAGGKRSPDELRSDLLKLAGDEEPPYFATMALAENWATGAVLGTDVALPCRVPWLRRVLRNYWRSDGASFSNC